MKRIEKSSCVQQDFVCYVFRMNNKNNLKMKVEQIYKYQTRYQIEQMQCYIVAGLQHAIITVCCNLYRNPVTQTSFAYKDYILCCWYINR